MNSWRNWTFLVGALVTLCGLFLLRFTGGPMILILGVLMLITGFLEPLYGRANGAPMGSEWQPTDERFVDPSTGKLVTVWFNSTSGERRYVETP